jgi:hypothetical protein
VPSLETAVVAAPGLDRHLERLLEHLEAVAQWGHGEAETLRLLDVPGGADAEVGPTARQHVERGRSLDPEPGLAVVDAADHQPEPCPAHVCRHVPERREALQHRLLDLAHAPDLEQVIHDPDRVEADLIGRPRDASEGLGDLGFATRPRE